MADPNLHGIFEETYLDVRTVEHRLYNLYEIQQLPRVGTDHPHYHEWEIRRRSAERFIKYLQKQEGIKRVLDLGCGNGWMTALIAGRCREVEVTGCDLNLFELKQASDVFNLSNLQFFYADIFATWADVEPFDLVVMASSLQYFHSLDELLKALTSHCRPGAEVHFIDTPFYHQSDKPAAIKRSEKYYREMGHKQMGALYYHHVLEDLEKYDTEFLQKPVPQLLRRVMPVSSPFYWVKIKL